MSSHETSAQTQDLAVGTSRISQRHYSLHCTLQIHVLSDPTTTTCSTQPTTRSAQFQNTNATTIVTPWWRKIIYNLSFEILKVHSTGKVESKSWVSKPLARGPSRAVIPPAGCPGRLASFFPSPFNFSWLLFKKSSFVFWISKLFIQHQSQIYNAKYIQRSLASFLVPTHVSSLYPGSLEKMNQQDGCVCECVDIHRHTQTHTHTFISRDWLMQLRRLTSPQVCRQQSGDSS